MRTNLEKLAPDGLDIWPVRARLDSLIKEAVPAGGVTTATPSKKAKGKAKK